MGQEQKTRWESFIGSDGVVNTWMRVDNTKLTVHRKWGKAGDPWIADYENKLLFARVFDTAEEAKEMMDKHWPEDYVLRVCIMPKNIDPHGAIQVYQELLLMYDQCTNVNDRISLSPEIVANMLHKLTQNGRKDLLTWGMI